MKIILATDFRTELMNKFNVTRAVVSLALSFKQNGITSRKIRHLALNKYGGLLVG